MPLITYFNPSGKVHQDHQTSILLEAEKKQISSPTLLGKLVGAQWEVKKSKLRNYVKQQFKFEKNHQMGQSNVRFVFNAPKNSLGGGNEGVAYLKNYFLPSYLFDEYAIGLFQQTSSKIIFEHFIMGIAFTKVNPLKPFIRSVEKAWEFHNFSKYYGDKKDTSSSYLSRAISIVAEVLMEKIAIRGKQLIVRRGWRTWRGSFLLRRRIIPTFLQVYRGLGHLTVYSLHSKFNWIAKIKAVKPIFLVFWTFTKTHRLYLNMRNGSDINYNYFSFGVGMFLKFFQKRRPLKRTKLFKLLLVQFLRKVLILSRIPNIHLVLNRGPTLFTELYRAFMTPSIARFKTLDRRD
jgi:hypothetical protein